MSLKKLVVIGSVNADHVLQVAKLARPGETIAGHGYRVIPGGKGANQAVAAARLGANIALIACVGDDDFGQRMIGKFQSDGIDTRGVITVPDTPTGIALIQIAASGENSIAISAEANRCLTPDALGPHRHLLREADTVLMQLESPLKTVEMAARQAREAGATVVLNPAPARPLPNSLMNALDILTPNETEAELLTGVVVESTSNAQQAAKGLHAKGVKIAIITLGARGAYYSGPEGSHRVKGFRVQAVDTTAAGDTFNGALVAGLQDGMDMDGAVRFANAAAAISVTRIGAQTSIPDRQEVDEFIKVNG